MNISLKTLPAKIASLFNHFKRYASFVCIIGFIGLYGFLVFQIHTLTQAEPDEDAVAEKLQTVKRPKIDQSAVDKIESLQDTNIEVQTLFKKARENPFQE